MILHKILPSLKVSFSGNLINLWPTKKTPQDFSEFNKLLVIFFWVTKGKGAKRKIAIKLYVSQKFVYVCMD